MKELSDLTAPTAIPTKPLLEAEVQSKCVAWMRGRGYWCRKFSSQSQRSVPDYLFAKPGLIFATEFKAPGKTSTDAQREEQKLMRAAVSISDRSISLSYRSATACTATCGPCTPPP